MQRPERIRFFITEQCRKLDSTFRNYMYPKQLLLGDAHLPLLEGSSLTFRVNAEKKISFRIRLSTENHQYPLNIGIPLSQVESISIKDQSSRNPEPAILFLLKNEALEKFVEICGPILGEPIQNGNHRRMSKYLTVILGMDPHSPRPNRIYCRIVLLANKFTFPFGTAKKILLKDLPIMWQDLLDQQFDRRKRTGLHHDREQISEMNDEAWEWLMGYLHLKWDVCPSGGLWLTRDWSNPRANSLQNDNLQRREAPSLMSDELLQPAKRSKYSDSAPESPGSTSSESTASVSIR